MLDLVVLGLLREQSMSGYELRKQLTGRLGAFWRVSYGSLYPCLKRLTARGALGVTDSPYRLRKRHRYHLTDHGEQIFLGLLESVGTQELAGDRFALRLAFFQYLRPEARLSQLQQRRGHLQAQLRDLSTQTQAAAGRSDTYTRSLAEHMLEEREREIAWLDRLVAAERSGMEGQEPARPALPSEPERLRPSSRPPPDHRRDTLTADEQVDDQEDLGPRDTGGPHRPGSAQLSPGTRSTDTPSASSGTATTRRSSQ